MNKDYCWFGEFWVDQNYREGAQGNPPFVSDRSNPRYNAERLTRAMRQQMQHLLDTERTNIIFQLQGCDFSNTNATLNYQQYDEIINYWNHLYGHEIQIIYSTPSKYIKALKQQNGFRKWALRKDDFFPFADDPDAYWTGFFTTRPLLKKHAREVSNMYHSTLRMHSMTELYNNATAED